MTPCGEDRPVSTGTPAMWSSERGVRGLWRTETEHSDGCKLRTHDRLGSRLDRIKVWLDESCGADGWAMTPSGTRGLLNDALSIYLGDPTLPSASSLDGGCQVETAGGVFQVREDESAPRVGATLHRTP